MSTLNDEYWFQNSIIPDPPTPNDFFIYFSN